MTNYTHNSWPYPSPQAVWQPQHRRECSLHRADEVTQNRPEEATLRICVCYGKPAGFLRKRHEECATHDDGDMDATALQEDDAPTLDNIREEETDDYPGGILIAVATR